MTPYMAFGVYDCRRCRERYVVNDGTWRLCSPTLCQSCYAVVEAIKEKQRCKNNWHKYDEDKPRYCPDCGEKIDESPYA